MTLWYYHAKKNAITVGETSNVRELLGRVRQPFESAGYRYCSLCRLEG